MSALSTTSPTGVLSAVSLDFDDTLLRSEECKAATMREVVSQYPSGLEALQRTPRDSRTAPPGVSVTRHTIFAAVAHALHAEGIRPGPACETAEAFGVRMCDEFSSLVLLRLAEADEVPGADALLRHLHAVGVRCHVNSATPRDALEKIIRARGWDRYIAKAWGAPASKLQNLAAIADAECLQPAELLHVGDGENDCSAAHQFGCAFVGVKTPEGGVRPFIGPVHAVVSDMHQACTEICRLTGRPAPPFPERTS